MRPWPDRWRSWRGAGLAALVVLVVIQLVPYGRDHTNPPVTNEPGWDADRTRELFVRACGDCHTRLTDWPWYSHVAPASWLVQRDVDEGREHLDATAFDPAAHHEEEAAEMVESGEMPLWYYLPLHPEARLADAEKTELIAGLRATFGTEGEGHDHEH